MFDSADTIASASCGSCAGPLSVGSYIHSDGPLVRPFCSASCLDLALRVRRHARWADRRRYTKRLALGTVFVGGLLTPHAGLLRQSVVPSVPPPADRADAPDEAAWEPLPTGWFGPEWPPKDDALLSALGRDAWLHPLAGPVRRMPRTDARVFGAVRPGNRAVECRNGHCGVDLGGEIYGEHVRAVHDGVVDYVQRAANPEHGGRFVRIAHRDGTVFTQYFHLAAIARGIDRGVFVKGGQVIGLLGDSGVKESAPHLHFAISIRRVKGGYEKYMDPEPLIALWPVHVPVDGSEIGLVTTITEPGVPLGSMPLLAGRKRKVMAPKGRGGGERNRTTAHAADEDGESAAPPDVGESTPPIDDAPPETAAPESLPEGQ